MAIDWAFNLTMNSSAETIVRYWKVGKKISAGSDIVFPLYSNSHQPWINEKLQYNTVNDTLVINSPAMLY
jgi:hypothetical protein